MRFDGGRLTIGRDPSNDVVLADPNVSRFHAEVVARDGADRAGRPRLAQRHAARRRAGRAAQLVSPASEIGIGPFGSSSTARASSPRDERGALRLDAEDVSRSTVKDKQILGADLARDRAGRVRRDHRRERLGQEHADQGARGRHDAVARARHRQRRAGLRPAHRHRLRAAGRHRPPRPDRARGAALRGPAAPARRHDRRRRSTRAVDARAGRARARPSTRTRVIGSLSGGQRKRTGVAAELLSRPSLLFLDEPTTGLDPGLETRMMALLRELADNSRAVAVVTHATKNLAPLRQGRGDGARRGADLLRRARRGARRSSAPTTSTASTTRSTRRPPSSGASASSRQAGQRRGRRSGDGRATVSAHGRGRRRGQARASPGARADPALPQAAAARPAQPRAADRPGPAARARQRRAVQVRALRPARGQPGGCRQLLFLLAITVIWLGSIDAAREIVKERSVFEREAAIGTQAQRLPGLEGARAVRARRGADAVCSRAIVLAVPPARCLSRRLR